MKKVYFLLLAFASTYMQAQTIPNAGFETWENNTETSYTYLVPLGWATEDLINTFYIGDTSSMVVLTNQSHSGQYAVLMQAYTSATYSIVLGGQIFSSPSLAAMNNYFGFPINSRPAFLQGYFKLNSVGGDFGSATVLLTKWNSATNKRDTLYAVTNQTTSAPSSYAQFNVPLSYAYNETPDTAQLSFGLQAGSGGQAHLGSQFFLDDLSFSGNVPLAIQQYDDGNVRAQIYPNPSTGNFTISSTQKIDVVKITNSLGQTINQTKPNTEITQIEINNPGVYFIRITAAGETNTQKVIVTH